MESKPIRSMKKQYKKKQPNIKYNENEISTDVSWMIQKLKTCMNEKEIQKVVINCYNLFGFDYKYKRKTGYHKKNGHRQAFTKVKIEKING